MVLVLMFLTCRWQFYLRNRRHRPSSSIDPSIDSFLGPLESELPRHQFGSTVTGFQAWPLCWGHEQIPMAGPIEGDVMNWARAGRVTIGGLPLLHSGGECYIPFLKLPTIMPFSQSA
jgi:hypothetical protein